MSACTQCSRPVEPYRGGRRPHHPDWCRRCRERAWGRVSNSERQRRYRQTDKGRLARRRYQQSKVYLKCQARLRKTEKYREIHRRYRETDKGYATRSRKWAKRRARKHNATMVESVDRMAIFQLDAGLCHLCDAAVEPGCFHLDHLIPLSVEPIEVAWNYAVAHPTCNQQKGNRLSTEVLSAAARARWQQHRPEHLAQLDGFRARASGPGARGTRPGARPRPWQSGCRGWWPR